MQRHLCRGCGRSYSEQVPELVERSWYTRAIHRKVIDQHLHLGSSLRRTVEWLRSEMGKQERWLQWHPLAEGRAAEGRCRLSVRTAGRWLAQAGMAAEQSVVGQLAGIACSGEMATDGLWARLRKGAKRVALLLTDCVSGLIYPPVVVADEERAASWQALFARAQLAGLSLAVINGLVSDGAHGLLSYLRQALPWVHQQRCVPQLPLGRHLWRNRGGRIAQQVKAAIAGLEGEAAQTLAEQVRDGLGQAMRAIRDAASYEEAERALGPLRLMP